MTVDLTTGIVRILKPDGSTAGTGFVVSDEGFVATCAHVVKIVGAGPGDAVRIVFHTSGQEAAARVEPEGWRLPDVEDTAFLQLSGSLPPGVVPAVLGASAGRSGAQVQAFGYPDLGQVEGLWGIGELIGPVTEARRPLLQLRSREITAGFSGGPVWDVATGHVIGMVAQVASPDRYGRLGEVAFAIPAEILAALCSLKLAQADPLVQMRVDYLAALQKRFEYLDLGGIAPRVQNRTVKLRMADVFVPLQARPEIESRLDLPDFMAEMPEYENDAELALRMMARSEHDVSARPVDIPDLLGKSRVVVLGDPGCGKSTLLRHVAYTIAISDGEAVGAAALARLPIFVRIIQYSQARAADPTLTLDRYVREVLAGKWARLIQAALDTGEALLLLDGLDEVIDAHQRKGIAEAIHALAADYPGNQFLVTSRIVGYQAARLTGDFVHYTVQPLPPKRIVEFVKKWYAAIECEAGEAELSEEIRERAEELSETIQARPGIRRLAENPLLLTIIALVNWRGRKLPNRRVELYAHAAETLIESWPYQRQGVKLETERVIRLLSPVAYRIFAMHSAGDITEDELLPVLTTAICHVDGTDRHEADKYTREFLSQVSEHSGIFRERGYDERGRRVFGFLHLTFAEYFTARYLAGLWEGLGDDAGARRTLLHKYAHVPRWHEVVLLMVGDVGLRDNDRAERATHLLGDILQLGSDYEEQLHRDLLLAGECLADDLRVQPKAVQHVLDRFLAALARPGMAGFVRTTLRGWRTTGYSQTMLRALVERLQRTDGLTRFEIARTLVDLDHAEASRALYAFLDDEDPEIRGKATWILGDLGDTRVFQVLIARLEDRSGWVREGAAYALGKLGDTRAIGPLQDRLTDEDTWVRWRAAYALDELRDETFESLATRLTAKAGDVRARTLRSFERFRDAQAIQALLSLLEDEDEHVRANAAWALGRLGDRQALEPLQARSQDESRWVRDRAVFALADLNDTSVVDQLYQRLEDDNKWVRWNAAKALDMLGDRNAVAPLQQLLEDDDSLVRNFAYRALIAILNRSASEPELGDTPCEPPAVSGPWDG